MTSSRDKKRRQVRWWRGGRRARDPGSELILGEGGSGARIINGIENNKNIYTLKSAADVTCLVLFPSMGVVQFPFA